VVVVETYLYQELRQQSFFNPDKDLIRLSGKRSDYFLTASTGGIPAGTAVFRNKGGEADELVPIIQGSTQALSLTGTYLRFTDDDFSVSDLNGSNGFVLKGIDSNDGSGFSVSSAWDVNGDGFDDIIVGAPGYAPVQSSSY